VLVGNRDEFHRRSTAALQWWSDAPILGGRDLEAGGTWFAADRQGRFGVITNLRGAAVPINPPSRGHLIPSFLSSNESPAHFLENLRHSAQRYAGFNLLLGDHSGIWLYSNGDITNIQALRRGCYAISNGAFGAPWPKVSRAKKALETCLAQRPWDPAWTRVLADRSIAADEWLPETGLPIETERNLSAAFIVQPDYGTRSTTVCVLYRRGGGWVAETSYAADGTPTPPIRFDLA